MHIARLTPHKKNRREQRCGYDVGYFDKPAIAKWADRQIEAVNEPSTALLDLAMIRHMHPIDVLQLLRTLGMPDPEYSIQIRIGFIGLLFQSHGISLQLAIRGLWALVYEPGVTDEQRLKIYCLDDWYDLAIEGVYGTMRDVEISLREFVGPYTARLKSEFPQFVLSDPSEFAW